MKLKFYITLLTTVDKHHKFNWILPIMQTMSQTTNPISCNTKTQGSRLSTAATNSSANKHQTIKHAI